MQSSFHPTFRGRWVGTRCLARQRRTEGPEGSRRCGELKRRGGGFWTSQVLIGCAVHRSAPCSIRRTGGRCCAGAGAAATSLVLWCPAGTAGQTPGPTAADRLGAGDAGLPHQRLRPGGPGRGGGTRVPTAATTTGAPVVPSTPVPNSDLDPDPSSGLHAAGGGPGVGGPGRGAGAAALAPGR